MASPGPLTASARRIVLAACLLAACSAPAPRASQTPAPLTQAPPRASVPVPEDAATPTLLPAGPPTSVATPMRTPPPVAQPLRDGAVNLAHLQRLTEVVEWDGEQVALVHIYSEAPDYGWVDASGEGLAAVDDVARAALVYLAYYERTDDPLALELARASLNFVRRLQAKDGEYYNFVYDLAGTLNTGGRTSYKSWSWWAARGQWALAAGYRVFRELDAAYADELQAAYLKGEQALRRTMGPVGAYDELHGVRVPAWLLGNGSDLSALAVLGLAEYYQSEPNTATEQLLTNLANGVAAYQLGGPGEYPFGAHPSTTTSTALWHAWGSHQVHALTVAGHLLDRQDWIDSAQREADTLFVRLLATDMLNEMLPLPRRGGQIAYGIEVMTAGFWSLYQTTGEAQYARYAGLAASWLFGNNMAGVAMYDPETGRGFDGIEGPTPQRVNRNAGAESTIEALYALMLIDRDPIASEYLDYRAVETPPMVVAEVEDGERLAGNATYGQRDWTGEARFSNGRYYALRTGDQVLVTLDVPATGAYLLYASHLRRAAPKLETLAEALRATMPILVDGALDEWQGAQPLVVDTREQILRGGAAWPGLEQASFTMYWMWDSTNLYVAARVRDPEHVQNESGPSVWRGDALWLYLDTRGTHASVDSKLTLAQTPAGPQVWNWTAQRFLPGAVAAWRAEVGGYAYEAALPLASLNFLKPEEVLRINFDAGMGFVGGFMSWTGLDPDTASNLAPLAFVPELAPIVLAGEALEATPDDVGFTVTLDSGPALLVPQSTSPDRDYLWLDRLTAEPIMLTMGQHTLLIEYAGHDLEGESIVDAFQLVPALACKRLENAAGQVVTLCYNMQSAIATWQAGP